MSTDTEQPADWAEQLVSTIRFPLPPSKELANLLRSAMQQQNASLETLAKKQREALREIGAGRLDHEFDPELFHQRARAVANEALALSQQQLADQIAELQVELRNTKSFWEAEQLLCVAAKQRAEAAEAKLEEANRLLAEEKDECSGLSRVVAQLQAELKGAKEFEAYVQTFGDYRKAFSNRAAML